MIKLSGITRTYEVGGKPLHALREFDLEIEAGGYIAIMGPSGSGKSTLLNIIGCLDRPTSGSYLLDGKEVAKLSETELSLVRRNKIGFVFQGFNLLPRTTALENVVLPLVYRRGTSTGGSRDRAAAALDMVGLGNRKHHEPNQLSGGQQQRVAIARALVNNPAILLADEPTGNLDSRTTLELLAILQHLNDNGITIVIVTHETDVAQHTKRIIEFRDGRIIADHPASSCQRLPSTANLSGG